MVHDSCSPVAEATDPRKGGDRNMTRKGLKKEIEAEAKDTRKETPIVTAIDAQATGERATSEKIMEQAADIAAKKGEEASEDLSKKTVEELVDLYNKLSTDEPKVKTFESKATAVRCVEDLLKKNLPKEIRGKLPNQMIWCDGEKKRIPLGGCEVRQSKPKNKCIDKCEYRKEEFTMAKKQAVKKAAKVSKEKKPTKFGKLREMFKQRKTWSAKDLMKGSGFDAQNLRTAISILKNKARTKEPIVADYDKDKQTYTLVK
jgi:hypothetical protein